jgi:hypothetical protein
VYTAVPYVYTETLWSRRFILQNFGFLLRTSSCCDVLVILNTELGDDEPPEEGGRSRRMTRSYVLIINRDPQGLVTLD